MATSAATQMTDMEAKWGKPVAARGFAQIPNHLLLINQFLVEERRLSPTELMVLVEIVATWWRKDEMPFPSLRTLAVRAGISDRQAQRAVSSLEAAGLLKRVRRTSGALIASNAYDLRPLVKFLTEVAKAFPNEFPRNLDRKKIQRLNRTLETSKVSVPRSEQRAEPPASAA